MEDEIMSLIKKIDELLYKFSRNLNVKTVPQGKMFVYGIFFLIAFIFVLFTGNKKMILIVTFCLLLSVYSIWDRFKEK